MKDAEEEALDWLDSDGDAPAQTGGDDLQDALEWLQQGQGEDAEAAPAEEGGLDWLGSGDAPEEEAAPSLLEEEEEPADGEGGTSMFSLAIDDFFESLEEQPQAKEEQPAEGAKTVVTAHKRRPRRSPQDQRVDKVMSTLIRYLTRKEPIRESQLDTIFRLTLGKMVDPLSAEVIVVYFRDAEGACHFGHMFYSRTLFRDQPQLEKKFATGLEALNKLKLLPGEGIVGRAIDGKKAVTSLDARHDPDFKNHLGDVTGYEVRTMLTVPIMDGPEVYGAIQVMNKDPESGEEFFNFQDLKLVEEIGGYLGRLIHLARDPDLERTDDEQARYIAKLAKTELFNFEDKNVYWEPTLWEVIGHDPIQKYLVLPLKKLDSKTLEVVMINPLDPVKRSGFEAATEHHIGHAWVGTEAQIRDVIVKVLGAAKAAAGSKKTDVADDEFGNLKNQLGGPAENVEVAISKDGESDDSGPIIKLVNRIIEDAYARGASDIHIEPYEEFARVRYRVDGNLQERMRLPLTAIPPIMSRLKIMSDLDIAERRLPQDGKIKFKKFARSGLDIDLRVATGPMVFGEKCVMRILAKGSISLGLDAMGFSESNLAKYRWACTQPYGMILNVGPTGSGKTTTLYSGLSEVNEIDVNIQTAEDPVEYPLDGINQMQMQKDIGLDFKRALRCYMRMDPDIILVGEIRDHETAEIAIEASLTGHLLFSTLHTNDAAGTVTRFIEMGIEPFMISSSLLVCCAQRLLRRLCSQCKVEWTPTDKELEILMWDPRPIAEGAKLYKHRDTRKDSKPCGKCGGAGYKGRCGTHEVMTLNDELRDLINKASSANIMKNAAVKAGMYTIFQDALYKVKGGITDLEDVAANVKADEKEGARQDEVGSIM